jgi:hypothetical protein
MRAGTKLHYLAMLTIAAAFVFVGADSRLHPAGSADYASPTLAQMSKKKTQRKKGSRKRKGKQKGRKDKAKRKCPPGEQVDRRTRGGCVRAIQTDPANPILTAATSAPSGSIRRR